MPGMNPRMMKQAMKRMGMAQEDIDATEVIIKCADKEIVISNPSVAKIKAMGTEQYTISGEVSERELDTTPEINEDDIKTVAEQAGVSEEKAKEALDEAKGDLAKAIMGLTESSE